MNDLKFTLQVLKDYGYDVPYVGRNICCLFHEENRPSARLFEEGSYHCWSAKCGVHFTDGLGAIMHLESCNFKDALQIAQDKYGFKITDKEFVSMKELRSLESSIVNFVTQNKCQLHMSIYKTLDTLLETKDIERMKKLYLKLKSGEIK